MDEIEQRLREASDACVAFYQEWRADEHNSERREKLQDSIHELRKVGSRLEIEMAISEREENAQKPLPIPPHRAKRDRNNNHRHDEDDSPGNEPDQMDRGQQRSRPQVRRSRRRSSGPKSSED